MFRAQARCLGTETGIVMRIGNEVISRVCGKSVATLNSYETQRSLPEPEGKVGNPWPRREPKETGLPTAFHSGTR